MKILADSVPLIEEEEIIMGDDNIVEVLNTFFSNFVSKRVTANNIGDPVLKCIASQHACYRRSLQQKRKASSFLFKNTKRQNPE